MRGELVLPAFQMDCRDWLVITPQEAGLPDEVAGTPLLAVLSSVVLDEDDFRSVSAVLTVGLLDENDGNTDSADRSDISGERIAVRLIDADDFDHDLDRANPARYLLPTPDRQLALLAEFTVTGSADSEVERRIEALMDSFRWAA